MGKDGSQWPDTRESLLLRVRDATDDAAWRAFVEIYRPVIYRMARGRGLQHADADDLIQQVFISIAGAIDGFQSGDDKPPFRSWLHRIARNAIINALTRGKPDQGSGSTSVREMIDAVPAQDELTRELDRQSREQVLRWAADQIRAEFSHGTWQMFWRTAIEGLAVEDVANELGRTTGAVYMARYRVMQRLKIKVTEVTDTWSE